MQALFTVVILVILLGLHLTLSGPLKRRWKSWEATLVSPEELQKKEEEKADRCPLAGIDMEGSGKRRVSGEVVCRETEASSASLVLDAS